MIKRNYRRKPEDQAYRFAKVICQRMKDDGQFVTLLTLITVFKVLITAFELAVANCADGGKKLTIIKNECLEAIFDQLDLLADGVDDIAKGNEKVVLDSGFELLTEAQSIDKINKPTGLEVKNNDERFGEAFGKWKSDKTVVGTMVEFQKVGETTWQAGPFCTADSVVLTGLESGIYYNVRIYGVGRKGLKSDTTAFVTVLVS